MRLLLTIAGASLGLMSGRSISAFEAPSSRPTQPSVVPLVVPDPPPPPPASPCPSALTTPQRAFARQRYHEMQVFWGNWRPPRSDPELAEADFAPLVDAIRPTVEHAEVDCTFEPCLLVVASLEPLDMDALLDDAGYAGALWNGSTRTSFEHGIVLSVYKAVLSHQDWMADDGDARWARKLLARMEYVRAKEWDAMFEAALPDPDRALPPPPPSIP